MNTHVFHFNVDVTAATTSVLRNQVLTAVTQNNADEIVLLISSSGGNLDNGFSTYNFLRSLKKPITAVNTGCVESIANIIFLAADKRVAVNNARFLLHEFHWGFSAGNVNHSRLREHLESLDFDASRFAEIFEERTASAKTKIDIRKCLHGDPLIIDSTAAIDAGLVQSICKPDNIVPVEKAVHWWVNA